MRINVVDPVSSLPIAILPFISSVVCGHVLGHKG